MSTVISEPIVGTKTAAGTAFVEADPDGPVIVLVAVAQQFVAGSAFGLAAVRSMGGPS
jgi:hypothetical protein